MNLVCGPNISSLSLMISLIMPLLHSFAPRMQFCSISTPWFLGLRPSLVTHSPLFVLTEEGNFWVKTYNCFLIQRYHSSDLYFPHSSAEWSCRNLIVPCLRKQKPCGNMPICQSLSGKMLLRLHCTSIITSQCVIIFGKYPLRYSMEINQTFPTSEYLGLMLMSSSHKSSDMTSCLLKQRR